MASTELGQVCVTLQCVCSMYGIFNMKMHIVKCFVLRNRVCNVNCFFISLFHMHGATFHHHQLDTFSIFIFVQQQQFNTDYDGFISCFLPQK